MFVFGLECCGLEAPMLDASLESRRLFAWGIGGVTLPGGGRASRCHGPYQ